jgi:hypothetical protein
VAVSFGYDMTRYAVCVTFAPTALLPPGVVLSIRNIRAVSNPADSLPAIGILAALGAFGGVLNKFPALTTSGSGSDPHRLARTISATLSDGTVDALLDEIEEFLTGIRHGAGPDRILATVLFTDIVDSTKQAAEMGDRKWGELQQRHHVHCAKGVGAVPWPGGEHGGGLFPDRF